MQKAFILNEEEYSMLQDQAKIIEQLRNENKTLREFNVAKRAQIDELKKSREHLQKELAVKAHEILIKEAELADLSSKLQEAKRNCMDISRTLEAVQKISARRLESMNNLMREIRRLRAEHVCIATNPQTGTVKVVSVEKADTYRKFGWIVSEEYLVDRPA